MLNHRKLLLIGAGGHCKSVISSLHSLLSYETVGIVDENTQAGSLMGIPIIGGDTDLMSLYSKGYTDAFVAVGNGTIRKKLFKYIEEMGFEIPNIIDKSSTIDTSVQLGRGIYVGKMAVVNTEASIGDGVILNTACVIEHECNIGEMAHIAPGAILCGNVTIGKETHIGAGSVIRQGIKVGGKAVIGMGSVVVKNIKGNVTAFGNPCKEVSGCL